MPGVVSTTPYDRRANNSAVNGIRPTHNAWLLDGGYNIDIGDRTITPMRPVTFDNPSTTAFVDSKTRALFSSDSFGALLPETAEDATDVSEDVLRGGQVAWTTVDSPWLHKVDRGLLASELNAIRQLDPSIVLSSHLPPAKGITDFMLDSIAAAPDSPSFVGPNQPALEAMLAEMTGAPA
jgi:hypothetical protein